MDTAVELSDRLRGEPIASPKVAGSVLRKRHLSHTDLLLRLQKALEGLAWSLAAAIGGDIYSGA